MHCHSNHALQHSTAFTAGAKRLRIKGFLRNGAAGTLTSGGGPKPCPYPSCLSSGWAWPSPPEPDPNPSSSSRPRRFVLAAPLGHSRRFLASHPSQLGCYPSSGRSRLRRWRTTPQQTIGLCIPGPRWQRPSRRLHREGVNYFDLLGLSKYNISVPVPSRAWQH